MIPKDDYSKAHPQLRTRDLANTANAMLEKVDALRMEAEADGVDFEENPHTGTDFAGVGNGSIRPEDTTVDTTHAHPKQTHLGCRSITDLRLAGRRLSSPHHSLAR